jgi:phage tail protein X
MTDFKLFQNRPLPQNIKLVLPDKAVTSLVQENIN